MSVHGDFLEDYMQACTPWLPAPDPCVLVTLPGGVELAADPGRSGAEYTLAAWSGWDEGTEVTGGATPWGTADGGVPGDVYLQGRNLSFSGLIVGRSPQHYWGLRQELGAVLTNGRWGVLRVDEDHLGLSRQVTVARGGRPVLGPPLSDRVGEYQVQFQSADSLRTDVDLQTVTVPTGGVDLGNIGNMPSQVSALLVGPLANPGLSWAGGAWTYQGSVASGQRILVQMWRRRVVDLATASHSRTRAQGSWLYVQPGGMRVSRTGTGSGRIELEWRSSWS
jgi:hypothetical protein